MNPKVSIIVLNYNGLNFLEALLPTIQAQTYENIETIVVDNNSSDGSQEFLRGQDWIVHVQLDDNYGYTGANNRAAVHATGDWLLFLNNDTELYPDAIEHLAGNARPNTILTPQQYLPIAEDGGFLATAGHGMDIFGYPVGQPDPTQTRLFYADGAAIFISRDDFNRIHGFDDDLFIFQEDIDLSWRARTVGIDVQRCLDAKLYHYSGGTVTGRATQKTQIKVKSSYFRRYLNERNVVRNILKNYSLLFCVPLLAILFAIHCAECLLLVVLGQWKHAGCYMKAWWWNLTHMGNTLRHRRRIQAARTVSDFTLVKSMYLCYFKIFSAIKYGLPQMG